MTRWLSAVMLVTVVSVGMKTHAAPPAPADTAIKARVDALLAQMTLDDKIGQVNQAGAIAFGPNAPKIEDVVRRGGAGSVLWLNDTKRFNALQKIAVEESPSKIPLLFALDVIHGYRTIFPVPLAMAASWDPAAGRTGADGRCREKPAPPGCTGPSARWSISPVMPAGAASSKAPARIPYLGCGDGGCPGTRLPGRSLGAPRPRRGLRQTLCRLRRR